MSDSSNHTVTDSARFAKRLCLFNCGSAVAAGVTCAILVCRTLPCRVETVAMVCANTLLLFLPLAVFWQLLATRVSSRWLVCFAFCANVALAWYLCVDAQVFGTNGTHISSYSEYLLHPDAIRLLDRGNRMGKWLLFWLVGVGVGTLLLWWIAGLLSALKISPRSSLISMASLVLAILIVIGGLVGERRHVRETLAAVPGPVRRIYPDPDVVLRQRVARRIQEQWPAGQAQIVTNLLNSSPLDKKALLPAESLRPNLVLIIMDSLRSDCFSADVMPRLYARAHQGLWLQRHYASSHNTIPGIFAILSGRVPFTIDSALKLGARQQLGYTLHEAGYEASFLSADSLDTKIESISRYTGPKAFDRVLITDEPDWAAADKGELDEIRRWIGEGKRPQFAVMQGMSTHSPYHYPAGFERHLPSLPQEQTNILDLRMHPELTERFRNRQRNAAGYADELICDFLDHIDLTKTLVVVTADHGESFGEDGALLHLSRFSEVQMHVPCLILGSGVPQRVVTQPTMHPDLLPTLLHVMAGRSMPISGCQGRDLLEPDGSHRLLAAVGTGANEVEGEIALFEPMNEGLLLRIQRYPPPMFEVVARLDMQGQLLPPRPPEDPFWNQWSTLVSEALFHQKP